VALKVAESFLEPSNCEHHAILRKAHHLCNRVRVVAGSCIREADCGNGRGGHRSCLLDEAVRLKLGQRAIRSSTTESPKIVGGRNPAC